MWYVYFLKSKEFDFRYTGSTNDLKRRFSDHNEKSVQSTKYYAPFILEAYIAVVTERQARSLEKYFKTGSGIAILRKRILQIESPG
jgi:putative endonuclease